MNQYLSPRSRTLARNALALLVGIAVAVVLVSLYEFLDTTLRRGLTHSEEDYLFKTRDLVAAAAVSSAWIATLLVLICVPIWLLLTKLNLAGWQSAALLGFVAPLVFWAFMWRSTPPVLDVLSSGLPYALCGTAAGLATWWAGLRRTRPIRDAE